MKKKGRTHERKKGKYNVTLIICRRKEMREIKSYSLYNKTQQRIKQKAEKVVCLTTGLPRGEKSQQGVAFPSVGFFLLV